MIKPVSTSNPYVYLDFLNDTGDSDVWNQAEGIVKSINTDFSIQASTNRLQNAATFLFTIANSQRANELSFLNHKIEELETLEKNKKQPEDIKTIRKRMKSLLKKSLKGGFDYIEFTRLLNLAMEKELDYKARLGSLLNNIENVGERKNKNLGLLEGLQTEVLTLIDLLNGEKKSLKNTTMAYSRIMPEIIYKYLQEHATNIIFNDRQTVAAGLVELSIKFRLYLEKEKALKNFHKDDKNAQEDINGRIKILSDKFQEFLKTDQDAQNFLQGTYNISYYRDLAKTFGFNSLLENNKTNKKYKALKFSTLKFNDQYDENQIVFSSDLSDTSISETLSKVLNKMMGTKPGSAINSAADAFLGSIKATYDINDPTSIANQQLIQTATGNMTNILQQFSQQRSDRENFYKNVTNMNDQLEQTLKELDAHILGEDQGFIIHESTKYYQSIEQGYGGQYNRQKKQFDYGFHGRTLAILNYIDTMNSISQSISGENFLGLDKNSLYFTAINLSSNAVASGMANKLEQIFSLAASLIMFDDTSVIVKEATKQLEFSNITNLHLYNLQGIYVPASYIIEQSARFLSGLQTTGNAAIAEITVPSLSVNEAQKGTEEEWERLKSAAISGTKISIRFFLNFNNFLVQLGKY